MRPRVWNHSAGALTRRGALSEVRLMDVHVSFGALHVLKGVSLTVKHGEVVCLLGPSGAGKSTLLRCVNNLVPPDRGHVFVENQLIGKRFVRGTLRVLGDRDLSRQRRGIGMVFQSFNLFSHLTVLENLLLAPALASNGSSAAARAGLVEKARDLLASVGLLDKIDAYPRQLSGGQQQRVAIARSLMMDPTIMLLDEPTSALDPELVNEVLAVIRRLADTGMTMLIVTHEIGFAREAADRIVFMDDGRVVEEGAPAEFLNSPRTERGRKFLTMI